ncbi:MAG: type III pantothenate kinase [Dehalococcoidia bacterium]|nr:type III pantothenate kinase [Dehalococcoidia bacterium]
MLLALDIGNTAITIGVFDGDRLRARWSIATDVENMVDEYAILLLNLLQTEGLKREDITEAILASVVPSLTPVFHEVSRRYFSVTPLTVDLGVKTGVRILYDSPRDVGADRVVDAVAASKLYGPPLIVVDFGTATVFDAISKEGDYVGGAIAPGIGISAQALFERTAKLPRIELERPRAAIGKTTVGAMQSGLVFGYVGLVEGIIARMKEELDPAAKVVATGGWAPLIARETKMIDVVNLDLTLIGLHLIFESNRGPGR